MKYIDIHGHVNFVAYDLDRDAVIKRAHDLEIGIITVGTQYDTSRLAVEIATKNEMTYAVIGLHPVHTSKSYHDKNELGEGNKEFTSRGEIFDENLYLDLANNQKTVAIGECGLDYYHLDDQLKVKQVKAFEQMIDLANKVKKPLMLHLRSGSSRSAYLDAYEILKNRSQVKANLHFYAGNLEEAKIFLDQGYYFSFTGVITFARNYDEIIKYLPLNRIMSETDCPYVSPLPYRGQRNEPARVVEVVKMIAQIKGIDEEIVRIELLKNAIEFFGISS